MNELRDTEQTGSPTSVARNISYASVAKSLANDYGYIFHINLQTGDFVKYAHRGEKQDLVADEKGTDFFGAHISRLVDMVHPEDRDTVFTAVTKENIEHVLSIDRSFILTFRIERGERYVYLEVKATRMIGDPQSIVVGITDVDAHMQRVAEYEKAQRDSHTFASILEAMAADYLNIYYVNTDTGDYTHYNPRKIYRGIGIDAGGTDFFGSRWRDLINTVHEEDQEAVTQVFSQEGLKKELAEHRTFIVVCRLLIRGKVKFVSIKVTRMEGETHHVVIGINDVDDQVRREEAHAKALGAAQAIANRDSLTGVKSKHAFAEAESAYNQMIKDGKIGAFSVVVCDVNGLKAINDTQGHKAGDELILQASQLVCTCFKQSPVYRVGGDEFVVVLTGDDYENRKSLLQSINAQIEENKKQGGVVIAIGAADFNPLDDHGFTPVFNRADTSMYMRKTDLKAR